MTNRNSKLDGACCRRLTRLGRWAVLLYAAVIVGCGENSSSEPRVDADAAKALRVKLLGDEAPDEGSSK